MQANLQFDADEIDALVYVISSVADGRVPPSKDIALRSLEASAVERLIASGHLQESNGRLYPVLSKLTLFLQVEDDP
jgi:hypothetical protein